MAVIPISVTAPHFSRGLSRRSRYAATPYAQQPPTRLDVALKHMGQAFQEWTHATTIFPKHQEVKICPLFFY
jgi:hypothetical protein